MLPLIDTVTREVLSYMAVEKINDSSYRYKTYNKKEILKTSPLNDTQKINSRPLLGLFAYFEKTVNGKIKSSFHGPSINFDFSNVNFRKSNPANSSNTIGTTKTNSIEKRVNVIPSGCRRLVLGSYYVDYNDGSYDLVLILSGCVSDTGLPEVVVSTIKKHNGDGNTSGGGLYSSGYTGPVAGNPLAWGAPGTGAGSGGSTGSISNGQGTGIPGAEGTEQSGIQQDPWNVFWVSATSSQSMSVTDVLSFRMGGLNDLERIWLSNNSNLASELNDFLAADNSQEAVDNAWQHLNALMNNPGYYDFVQNYESNNSGQGVWWENDTWISDPNNINFDIDGDLTQGYKGLTEPEKVVARANPVAAYFVGKNSTLAINNAVTIIGGSLLNDRADAFRHAAWSAMNERDCGKTSNLESIAKKFGDAHEVTTPSQLVKEKQMDLFNNAVGYDIGDVVFRSLLSNDDIFSAVATKVWAGQLRILAPLLSKAQDPNFDGTNGVVNPSTATHGITSATALIPSN